MNEFNLSLTAEERTLLSNLLERTLEKKQVEEHRTRAPSYRAHVMHDEELLADMLRKLQTPPR